MSPRSRARTAVPYLIGAVFFLHLLAVPASGQARQPLNPPTQLGRDSSQVYLSHSGQALVRLSVYAENGKTNLDRQSLVKITNQATQAVSWQTTDEKSEAALVLTFGNYEIEVSAVGYLSEQKQVQANNEIETIRISFALRRDPDAVDFNISNEGMPAKVRGDAKRAVSALKSANFKEAKKRLDAAYKVSPANSDLNYLMGYLFYEQGDMAQARNYLATAANLSSHNLRALTLLGQVQFVQQDYIGAAASLEKAVDTDSANWMAHNLLANAYLKLKKYEEAQQQAELALANGKTGASVANLALGQALVNLGNKEEGIKALKVFVRNSPSDPSVPLVRDLIAQLESGKTGFSIIEAAQRSETPLPIIENPVFATPELPVSVNPWRPPGIDEAKPQVADGVSCPAESVIEQSGERVKELVDDVSRIAAIEHLVHEQVDEMGNPSTKETRNYNYVASISDKLGVDEYRSERHTIADFPDRIASSGFAALALVFHPDMRESFEMTCEGLGTWHGQAAWMVRFRQRDDRLARLSDCNVGGQTYSLRVKGRAWITADKYEIVRIESELINPMPQIQLRCEQQVVEYGPVRFRKGLELWLPTKAEIYLDYRKRRYYRSHSYDHYMLFSIDSVEKRSEPKAPPTEETEKPASN